MNDAPVKLSKRGPRGLEQFVARARKAAAHEDWEAVRSLSEAYLDGQPNCVEALVLLSIAEFYRDNLAGATELAKRAFTAADSVAEIADLLAVYFALAGDVNTTVYYAKLFTALTSSPKVKELIPESFPKWAKVFQNMDERPLLARGYVAIQRKEWSEAEDWMRQQIAFEPDCQKAHLGLAMSLIAQGEARSAVDALRSARHPLPYDAQIASQLGDALASVGQFAESQACHRWATTLAPEDAAIHALSVVDRFYDPGEKPADLVAAVRDWGHRFGVKDDPAEARVAARPKDRLTVGFVVGDQGTSPVGIALAAILAHHDSRRIEAIGFGFGDLGAAANVVFQKCVDRWHNVSGIDPVTLRTIVGAEEIDVLIDVAGFHCPDLLVAFGQRMAPCQASLSGSPLGTGLAGMDYLVTDRCIDPDPVKDGLYRETLAYLDLGSVVVAPIGAESDAVQPRESDEITFAADANLMELNAASAEMWAHVLHSVPDSKLILCDYGYRAGENLAQLTSLWGNFGLAHRVDVVSDLLPTSFFGRGDIALMPMPFPRPQSALDALWAGTPVIGLGRGGRQGRAVASLLHHLGLGNELVGATPAEGVRLAVAWARNATKRAEFRATIRDRITTRPSLDPKARMRDLERLLAELWARSCGRG